MKTLISLLKHLPLFVLVLWASALMAQVPFPLVIENVTHTSGNYNYSSCGDILSPVQANHPVFFGSTAKVTYKAGNSIALNPGFSAGSFTATAFFSAEIDCPIDVALITPDASQVIDGVVHVNKWEKLEIGITLPTEYQTAVNNFFYHYYTLPPVDPCHDLNPYADDSLILQMDLTSPSGAHIVKYGFFCRMPAFNQHHANATSNNQYVINPFNPDADYLGADPGNPLSIYPIRFRFAPNEMDASVPWQFSISISVLPAINANCNPDYPSYTFSGFQFICDPPLPSNKGYVRVNTTNHQNFKFDDGDPFFPIGENGFGGRDDFNLGLSSGYVIAFPIYSPLKIDYDNFDNAITEMSNAGGNYVRFWLSKDNFNLEWNNLGVYDEFHSSNQCNPSQITNTWSGNSQYNCWWLDHAFDILHDKGVYAQLCVDPALPTGGGMAWGWGDNAYVKFLGTIPTGYDNTLEYFTNQTLRYYWKRKYKYVLSRWGYSTNLAVVETFNELDQVIGYNEVQHANLCPGVGPPNGDYCFSPGDVATLRSAIDDWHTDILSYAKDDIDENDHLYSVSYTVNGAWTHTDANSSCTAVTDIADFDAYYNLFNNPYIDIRDIHHYEDGTGTSPDLLNHTYYFVIDHIRTLSSSPNKPYRMGEFDTFGNVQVPNSLSHCESSQPPNYLCDESTSHFYNNHELIFHNNIWATTFWGGAGMSLPWFSNLVHRFKNQTNSYIPESPTVVEHRGYQRISAGDTYTMFSNQYTIQSHYNEFSKLSEFISNHIDFTNSFTPHTAYPNTNVNTCSDCKNIESYYLVKQDQSKSYGWVHYVEKYWRNAYYLTDTYYDLDCSDYATPGNLPPFPSTDKVILEGFNTNTNYWIKCFPTRTGQEPYLPCYTTPCPLTSNSGGDLTLTQSLLNLGCDKMHADYAYVISDSPNDFRAATAENIEGYDFEIIPNPAIGIFTIKLPGDELSTIYLYDVYGKELLHLSNNSLKEIQFDRGSYESGIYFVRVKSGSYEKVKRLVILD